MKHFIGLIFCLVITNASNAQIIINELFPDPSPPLNLPEAEFIELYNPSNNTISLANWSLADASSEVFFETSHQIEADQFMIVIDDSDLELFEAYNNVIGISSFPSLNNAADEIKLRNELGELVDAVNYTTNWYNDALKEDGGWTLERINPFTNCGGASNWSASNNSNGGSPGQENSIVDVEATDTSQIILERIWLNENQQLELEFNKAVDSNSALTTSSYQFQPSLQPLSVSIENSNLLRIDFLTPIQEETIYTIEILNVKDCEQITSFSGNAVFGIPQQISEQDLLINEILFNPASGGVDFIELLNHSQKLLSVDDITVLELNPQMPTVIDDFIAIDNEFRYLLPDSLYVLTSDSEIIRSQYEVQSPNKLIEVSIPNYADDEGIISILNPQLDTIDQLHYFEDWHFAGLSDVNGVSLERLSPNEITQRESNWYSASFSAGFATPTAPNSQLSSPTNSNETGLILSHQVFTPDQDGMDDFLDINFELEGLGNTATIRIFSVRGYVVRSLVNNQLIDTSNSFRWDGLDDDGKNLAIGPYIIVAEVYDEEGNQQQFKEKVVLSRKAY